MASAHASVVLPSACAARVAGSIAPLAHAEAAAIATEELARFDALAQELSREDWLLPTVCHLWNVRQVVGYVAGAAAAYARPKELARQWNPLVQRAHRRPGFSLLDSLNQV